MQYHSTRNHQTTVDSAQAVLSGLAPDGGLYVPAKLPPFDVQACLASSTMDMAKPMTDSNASIQNFRPLQRISPLAIRQKK